MREFYFEDKKKQISYRGIVPNNDENCKPLEYFMLSHAFNAAKQIMDNYNHHVFVGPRPDDKTIFKFAYDKVYDLVVATFRRCKIKQELRDLLKYDGIKKRQQEKLLKGLLLSADDIICLLAEAEFSGYLMDIYHIEKDPICFEGRQFPMCFAKKDDGTFDVFGKTDLTDGELDSILQQRKVVQARVFHKENHWLCFYFTLRGIAGEEHGDHGSVPHWHFLSDKFGYTREQLNQFIQNCDMPSSKTHIFIERNAW